MGLGAGYTKHLDETLRAGIYEHQIPNINFLYTNSSTQDPNYAVGDKVVLPDGRVFRYGKAAAGLDPKLGAQNSKTYLAIGNLAKEAAVGDMTLSFTLDGTSDDTDYFGTANQMVGAYVSQPDSTSKLFRRIVQHETGSTGDIITVTLDAAVPYVIDAGEMCEILPNPYAYLKQSQGTHVAVMGIPTVVVTSGYYCWVQTWGLCWVAPWAKADFGGSYDQMAVFTEGGNITDMDSSSNNAQIAGHIVEKRGSGDWSTPPFIDLQISQ